MILYTICIAYLPFFHAFVIPTKVYSVYVHFYSVSHHLSTRLLPVFISLKQSIALTNFFIEIFTSAVFAYIPSYTCIPVLDTCTELVETWHQIIIYRNDISIIGLPLLRMIQSLESWIKWFTNLNSYIYSITENSKKNIFVIY